MVESYIMIIIVTITYFITKMMPIKKKNEIFLLVCFCEVFVILSLRTPISDMIVYIKSFHNIASMGIQEMMSLDWDKGYILLNKLISFISTSDISFTIITSFIGLIGPYIFIKRYSKNYWLSMIIYIGLNFMVIQYYLIRQSIALTFIILSIEAIKQNKIAKFITYIVMATMFHTSALIFSVVIILTNINIRKKWIYACFVLTFVFKQNIALLLGRFSDYSIYTDGVNDTFAGITMLILFIICYVFMQVLDYYNNKKQKEIADKNEKILSVMFLIAIFFQILALNTNIIARIVMYFSISLVALIPNYIKKIGDKYLKVTITLLLFILIFGYSCSLDNVYQYIPFYRS